MVEIKLHGKTIRTSRNLRGIMEHARRFHFATILTQSGNNLTARFPDGSECVTVFASAHGLTGWINDRVKYGRGRFNRPIGRV